MKTLHVVALALICCGCATTQRETFGKLDKIVIPQVDFREACLSDAIEFIVQAIEPEPPGHPRLSIILHPEIPSVPDPQKEKRFAKLRDYCRDKSITLQLRDCTLRTLADFVMDYAEVSYRVRNGHVTLLGRNAEVLVE